MINYQAPSDNLAGTAPEVDDKLEVSEETQYTVADSNQATEICRSQKHEAEWLIRNQATITEFVNGRRPYDPTVLARLGKGHRRNLNTGWLMAECNRIPNKFFMPILKADVLTAASLPQNWAGGETKSEKFRRCVTKTIREWVDWPWFCKQLFREMTRVGFGFATYLDEYEWRPTFVRQDRGFVPPGTEIMGEPPKMWVVEYDYQVDELLRIAKKAEEKGSTAWKYEAVADAINNATVKMASTDAESARRWAEMRRETTIRTGVDKGFRVVTAWHLFSVDPDGTVSHQIVLADTAAQAPSTQGPSGTSTLLYEKRGRFKTMADVLAWLAFDPDAGTLHSSWGVGQLLVDMSIEYDRAFSDWLSALGQAGKLKVATDKEPNEVKLQIDESMMVVSGGTLAGNIAAVSDDPEPRRMALIAIDAAARKKIQDFLPPIELTPKDVKAGQINDAVKEQQQQAEERLHLALKQFARLIGMMVRRICDVDTNDEEALKAQKYLMEVDGLTREEIDLLANQPPINTIDDFTPYAKSKKAAFAAAKAGNPNYDQKRLETVQAEAAGGQQFADYVLIPGEDQTTQDIAMRQQQLETTAMKAGETIAVLGLDAHLFHMTALEPDLTEAVMTGNWEVATKMLTHYAAHFQNAKDLKQFTDQQDGNREKSIIANSLKAIREQTVPQEQLAKPDMMAQVEQLLQQPNQQQGAMQPMAEAPEGMGGMNYA